MSTAAGETCEAADHSPHVGLTDARPVTSAFESQSLVQLRDGFLRLFVERLIVRAHNHRYPADFDSCNRWVHSGGSSSLVFYAEVKGLIPGRYEALEQERAAT